MRLKLRRGVVAMLLFVTCCICDGGAQTQDMSPSNWTQFRWVPTNNAIIAPEYDFAASWTTAIGGAFSSSPTIAHGVLFVASNAGNVAALDLRTGDVRWLRKFEEPVMTAPLVWQGTVIVGAGNEHLIDWQPGRYFEIGLGQNSLYGLDEGRGTVTWRVGIPGTGMPTGTVQNGIYYHHDGAGMLFAVAARGGQYLWRKDLGAASAMSAIAPVTSDLFVTGGTSPNEVIAFAPKDGEVVWRHRFADDAGGVGDCPLATDGNFVVGDYLTPVDTSVTQVHDGVVGSQHVYALDALTGKLVWDRVIATGTVPVRNESAIPVIANDAVYVGSGLEESMHALNLKTGETLWVASTHGPVKGGAVVDNGNVYVGDGAGFLWAFDAATGHPYGSIKAGSGFGVGSPIVFGQTLYIGGQDGNVYARPLALIEGAR